jgi:hypothetical protein
VDRETGFIRLGFERETRVLVELVALAERLELGRIDLADDVEPQQLALARLPFERVIEADLAVPVVGVEPADAQAVDLAVALIPERDRIATGRRRCLGGAS